ncbi:DUF1194 domain-containing protein [Oceanicola sp. S124]|uniref:DUF1194 domain-containing protein n=1 Tax=Oceanicola sp. S124 TaxID=1042378 RepID=UPI0002557E13|nr:DUF1194 domain-containing protein [Oceanicola sp. S124]
MIRGARILVLAAGLLACAVAPCPGAAQAIGDDPGRACREALALGLDVSGSVDDGEYRLQLEGLARALDNPQVREALFALPGAPVRLMVYEWSGPADQRVLAPWSEIGSPAALAAFQARLRAARRQPMDPSTAIAPALLFGAEALARHPGCWRRVLDLSGDGRHNTGPVPRQLDLPGITVNGLVIARPDRIAELSAYYRAHVLRGTDAFVESAFGFRDFEQAMVRKLLKELAILPLSGDGPALLRDDLPRRGERLR